MQQEFPEAAAPGTGPAPHTAPRRFPPGPPARPASSAPPQTGSPPPPCRTGPRPAQTRPGFLWNHLVPPWKAPFVCVVRAKRCTANRLPLCRVPRPNLHGTSPIQDNIFRPVRQENACTRTGLPANAPGHRRFLSVCATINRDEARPEAIRRFPSCYSPAESLRRLQRTCAKPV